MSVTLSHMQTAIYICAMMKMTSNRKVEVTGPPKGALKGQQRPPSASGAAQVHVQSQLPTASCPAATCCQRVMHTTVQRRSRCSSLRRPCSHIASLLAMQSTPAPVQHPQSPLALPEPKTKATNILCCLREEDSRMKRACCSLRWSAAALAAAQELNRRSQQLG